MSKNSMNGAMVATSLSSEQSRSLLKDYGTISIACYNSPESITLSGNNDEILALKDILEARGIFARTLATDGNAYHSSHMRPLGVSYQIELTEMLSRASNKRGNTRQRLSDFISSVDGKVYKKPYVDAHYWRSNLESPVLFHQAVTNLVQNFSVDLLVEIGPHTALQGPLRQIAKSLQGKRFPEYVPSLIRKENSAINLLQTAGMLFSKGYDLDIQRVNSVEVLDQTTNTVLDVKPGSTIVDLPRYQWQYSDPLYLENRSNKELRLRSHGRHDLLGSRTAGGNRNEPMWRNMIHSKGLPWLQDHRVNFRPIFVSRIDTNLGGRWAAVQSSLHLRTCLWPSKQPLRWQRLRALGYRALRPSYWRMFLSGRSYTYLTVAMISIVMVLRSSSDSILVSSMTIATMNLFTISR